jgi:hypothetical protein
MLSTLCKQLKSYVSDIFLRIFCSSVKANLTVINAFDSRIERCALNVISFYCYTSLCFILR